MLAATWRSIAIKGQRTCKDVCCAVPTTEAPDSFVVLDHGILKVTTLRERSGLKENLKLVEREAWYLVLKLVLEGIVSSPVMN